MKFRDKFKMKFKGSLCDILVDNGGQLKPKGPEKAPCHKIAEGACLLCTKDVCTFHVHRDTTSPLVAQLFGNVIFCDSCGRTAETWLLSPAAEYVLAPVSAQLIEGLRADIGAKALKTEDE